MMSDIEEKILKLFSNVLSVPMEQVTPNAKPEDYENWDSMRHMMLLLSVESEFDLKFSDEEMVSVGTLTQLIELAKSKRDEV